MTGTATDSCRRTESQSPSSMMIASPIAAHGLSHGTMLGRHGLVSDPQARKAAKASRRHADADHRAHCSFDDGVRPKVNG